MRVAAFPFFLPVLDQQVRKVKKDSMDQKWDDKEEYQHA